MYDEKWMRMAITEAHAALAEGEVPVGAIIVCDGVVIATAHNTRQASGDPTAHAEILALRKAAKHLGNWRLSGCELYVTLEPCPMCAGAILQSRLKHLYFGAYDTLAGCCGSIYRLTEDPAFNDFTPATGGFLKDCCAELLHRFATR